MIAPSVICKIMKVATKRPTGERGEIVIQGENVMKGYFKNPEATSEVLVDGSDGRWLWTGDLGYFDQDGFLVVTGRAKALLIAKDGEKYSPEEVEEVMINHTDILNQLIVYNDHNAFTCALLTLQDDLIQKLIKQEQLETPEAAYKRIFELLQAYESSVGKSIPPQWLPARFALIDKPFREADGLVNSTMKLVRFKIVERYKDRIDALYESEQLNEQQNIETIKNLYFS